MVKRVSWFFVLSASRKDHTGEVTRHARFKYYH